MSQNYKGIFVTGTDTGVGKTVVSAALSWSLRQAGRNVAVTKPVQTGTNIGSAMDIEFVAKVIETDHALEDVCPYRFPEPLAPLIAARLAGEEIDIEKIRSLFNKLSAGHDIVIVEGAGGLLVPITENYLMSDLAVELGLPVLIVVRPSLGTLNHTVLTVECAMARGLQILGIVINQFPLSPGLAERTNPELILKMTGERIVGVIPFDPEVSVEKGIVGGIRSVASTCFISELGGSFVVEDFLSKLR